MRQPLGARALEKQDRFSDTSGTTTCEPIARSGLPGYRETAGVVASTPPGRARGAGLRPRNPDLRATGDVAWEPRQVPTRPALVAAPTSHRI